MKEIIVIEAGHFDPVELPVYGEGVYAAVAVSLPRDTNVTPWGQPVSEEPGQVNSPPCPKVLRAEQLQKTERSPSEEGNSSNKRFSRRNMDWTLSHPSQLGTRFR